MHNGIPLTDADRWDWLIALREAAVKSVTATDNTTTGPSPSSSSASAPPSSSSSSILNGSSPLPPQHQQHHQPPHACTISCSALKLKYRDIFRSTPYKTPGIAIHFIYLDVPEAVLVERMGRRQGHFMKPGMVRGQLEDLEEPGAEELQLDVLRVDCARRDLDEVQGLVREMVRGVLEGAGG
jgi:gluconokinase